jgi:transposase
MRTELYATFNSLPATPSWRRAAGFQEVKMNQFDTCGIKVRARELVVGLRRHENLEPPRTFTNTPRGWEMVVHYLRQAGRVVRVCLEPTGLYGLELALALSAAEGIEVMTVNPRAVRNFAQAVMGRSKSDPIDAGVLEEFAACMPFQPWQRPEPNALALHALARQLRRLMEMQWAEENRQPAVAVTREAVRRDPARRRRAQERSIQRLTLRARQLIGCDPHLTQRLALLDSVPGIDETSAVQFLGEIAVLAPASLSASRRRMLDWIPSSAVQEIPRLGSRA